MGSSIVTKVASRKFLTIGLLVFFEFLFAVYVLNAFVPLAVGYIGDTENVSVSLTVGASYPTILNVSINQWTDSVTLTANTTTTVNCVSRIVDFNGEYEIAGVTGALFDENNATYGDDADNNNYYYNDSCQLIHDFTTWEGYSDDEYHILSNCTFEIEYYANPSVWNCTVLVTDNDSLTDINSDNITINELLAFGIPDSIDYGTVNATYVSDEQQFDVENLGNVELDVQMSAFGVVPNDLLAMNCTLGLNGTIGLEHERYNVTNSTPGALSLTEFSESYKAVSDNSVLEQLNLNYRFNDVASEAINPTYWRMYVPRGVAGTCTGKVQISALKSE